MSVRDDIKDNVVTTLQGITIAAGYSFDMGEVSKKRYQEADWGGNELWPKACLYPGNEVSRPRIGWNIYDHFWNFGIRFWYKGDTASDELNQMIGDVRFAMLRDGSITRGGFAWNTCYAGMDEEIDTFEKDRLHSSIVLNFTIHYREVYGGCN